MAKYTPEKKWDFAISKVLFKLIAPKGYHKHPRFGMVSRIQMTDMQADKVVQAAILMQRDFKQELIKLIAPKLQRKAEYAKSFSWLNRVIWRRIEYHCVLSEIDALEKVILDIENVVPSTVTETDFRDWPNDLKVGDFVFDAGMRIAVQVENEEEIQIYKRNWKKNRFATLEEINKVINKQQL